MAIVERLYRCNVKSRKVRPQLVDASLVPSQARINKTGACHVGTQPGVFQKIRELSPGTEEVVDEDECVGMQEFTSDMLGIEKPTGFDT